MKRQDLVCENCESECTIETTNMEDPIAFCPICGSESDFESDEASVAWDIGEEENWD